MIFPAAWGVALDVRMDPDKQNSGQEHSVRQSCFPCTYVSHLPENGCGVLQW